MTERYTGRNEQKVIVVRPELKPSEALEGLFKKFLVPRAQTHKLGVFASYRAVLDQQQFERDVYKDEIDYVSQRFSRFEYPIYPSGEMATKKIGENVLRVAFWPKNQPQFNELIRDLRQLPDIVPSSPKDEYLFVDFSADDMKSSVLRAFPQYAAQFGKVVTQPWAMTDYIVAPHHLTYVESSIPVLTTQKPAPNKTSTYRSAAS